MFRDNNIKKLLEMYHRHLQKLNEQKASFGLHTPPHILIEIEDTEAKINELQEELKSQEKNTIARDKKNWPFFWRFSILVIALLIAGVYVTTYLWGRKTNDNAETVGNLPRTESASENSETVSAHIYSPTPSPTVQEIDASQTEILTPTEGEFVSAETQDSLSPSFEPSKKGEILILIVSFFGNEDIKPEARIEKFLSQEFATISDFVNVRVERYPYPIHEINSDIELKHIKETYAPSIIIWGWYDEIGITANFEFTHLNAEFAEINGFIFGEYKPTLAEGLRLSSDPDKFVFHVSRDLPQQITYLSLFAIGKIYAMGKNYEQAQSYLKRAINNLPEEIKDTDDEVTLRLILADVSVVGLSDFDYGIKVTSQIIEDNPEELAAYELRGMTYELTAISKYIEENNITVSSDFDIQDNEEVIVISSDKEIPLKAFKSDEALADYNYVIENDFGRPEIYYRRGIQNYAFNNIELAISDMQQFTLARQDGFLTEQAEKYVDLWSSELSQ